MSFDPQSPPNPFTGDGDFTVNRANVDASFSVINVAANTDTAGSVTDDYRVPDGYNLEFTRLSCTSNEARTAGTATLKVVIDGSTVVSGPEAVLDATNTTNDEGRLAVPGSVRATEGQIVNLVATADAAWLPITSDLKGVLYGYLDPVQGTA